MLSDVISDQFDPLSTQLQKYIDENKTGGISCLVYHKDQIVFCKTYGWKDKVNQIPLSYDTIFRIYSMTKPIVCLGLLTLYDEDKFQLDDPISKYIPEFTDSKVLKSFDPENNEIITENAQTPITIRELFTHTAGLTYGHITVIPGEKLYESIFNFNPKKPIEILQNLRDLPTLQEWVKTFVKVPLLYHPGTHYWYSHGTDVLGLLIEKLSGKKLDEFLRKVFFDKLEMNDTDFCIPKNKSYRLSKAFTLDDNLRLTQLDGKTDNSFMQRPRFLSGGGGLLSTLEDYMKFTKMILDGGIYNGNQIVSKRIIDLMTQNNLPDGKSPFDMALIPSQDPDLIKVNTGFGYGLGVKVKTSKNFISSGIGTHEWFGAMNTLYWIDPKNQLFTILMTQYCPPNFKWEFIIDSTLIKKLVYEAIESVQVDLMMNED